MAVTRVLRYFDSMAGRFFLLLLVGVIGSACVALGLANARRHADLQQLNLAWIANRVQDYVALLNTAPPSAREAIIAQGIPGLRVAGGERAEGPDPQFSAVLAARNFGAGPSQRAIPSSCVSPLRTSFYLRINCWLIPVRLEDGSVITLTALSPRTEQFESSFPNQSSFPDPLFLLILTGSVGVLAYLIARMAAAPLRDLSRAARDLGRDLERSPLPERGPFEVRDAIRAFNTMQARLRRFITERTRILASITHDLQTPLTRLRLRLEKVEDPALRSRLIDDLGGMQMLIRQGLDLCRGSHTEEPFMVIALDSMLDSVVEDAAEGGLPVALTQRCGYDVEAQPKALQRCLANLLDNALKYGGGAEVSASFEQGAVQVRIRDHGPGIPADKLQAVFEPYYRLEAAASTASGIGLGLTIARMLAEQNEATLTLRNHPTGGLEACLTLQRGLSLRQRDAGPTVGLVDEPVYDVSVRSRGEAASLPARCLPQA